MIEYIGFIGGGQMGEAMLKGLLQAKTYSPEQILVAEPVETRRDYLKKTYQVRAAARLEEFAENIDIIVLAVKPQVMHQVLDSLQPVYRGQLIITIAAGLLHDVVVCNVKTRPHLDRADIAGPGDLQGLVGDQPHRHAHPLRGPEQDVLDHLRAGVGIDPDLF